MTAAFFVARHRTPNGAPCRTVPCDTCQRPVKNNAHREGRLVFCSAACKTRHPFWHAIQGGKKDVDDVLEALDRALWLPSRYSGRPGIQAC
jgi:hypothetical protein